MQEQIKRRTKQIGLEIIKLLDELPSKPSSWAIARQIVRSSTSVVQITEQPAGQSQPADFIYKLKIVEEETDETMFWLEILEESNLIKYERIKLVKLELNEILAIVVSSIKTVKAKIGR